MSSVQNNQPTFLRGAPRFVVQNMEQALAFYGQPGFQTTYHDEGFAIIERDGVALLSRSGCHSERSEESSVGNARILRCAQNDKLDGS